MQRFLYSATTLATSHEVDMLLRFNISALPKQIQVREDAAMIINRLPIAELRGKLRQFAEHRWLVPLRHLSSVGHEQWKLDPSAAAIHLGVSKAVTFGLMNLTTPVDEAVTCNTMSPT
mmetsp:Transcript_4130/g.6891  ORF Transcript_4130/g.6891 Transcript_4130/m.6891 type:complete len:118 (-) Transcript_4130:71-424(-)